MLSQSVCYTEVLKGTVSNRLNSAANRVLSHADLCIVLCYVHCIFCEPACSHTYTQQCELVLRIRADDPTAELPLGSKYGANIDEVIYTLHIMN
jgi:hypothetical protein